MAIESQAVVGEAVQEAVKLLPSMAVRLKFEGGSGAWAKTEYEKINSKITKLAKSL